MKQSFTLLLLLALGAAGCRHDADLPEPGSLAGSWRLTRVQCYCSTSPVPDELLTFSSGQRFQLLRDGRLSSEGTYGLSRSPACGQTTDRDQLTFRVASPGTYAPSGAYTLAGSTLVVDQTNNCISDQPVYTYQRVPEG